MKRINLLIYNLLIVVILFYSCVENENKRIAVKDSVDIQSKNEDYNINNYNKLFKSIPLSKISDVCVDIAMNGGKLNISNESKNLINASILYKEKELKPEINYSEVNNHGALQISHSQRENNNHSFKDNNEVRNLWDLKFNNNILWNFDIKFGAGEANFKLSNLLINNLNIRLGAGKIRIDLKENKALKNIDIEMGVSDAEVDFRNVNHDVTGSIVGGIGKIKLQLPKNTGVKINLSKGIGKLETKGLSKQNSSTYINDAYGKSENNIELKIKAGIGKIELEVEE